MKRHKIECNALGQCRCAFDPSGKPVFDSHSTRGICPSINAHRNRRRKKINKRVKISFGKIERPVIVYNAIAGRFPISTLISTAS